MIPRSCPLYTRPEDTGSMSQQEETTPCRAVDICTAAGEFCFSAAHHQPGVTAYVPCLLLVPAGSVLDPCCPVTRSRRRRTTSGRRRSRTASRDGTTKASEGSSRTWLMPSATPRSQTFVSPRCAAVVYFLDALQRPVGHIFSGKRSYCNIFGRCLLGLSTLGVCCVHFDLFRSTVDVSSRGVLFPALV